MKRVAAAPAHVEPDDENDVEALEKRTAQGVSPAPLKPGRTAARPAVESRSARSTRRGRGGPRPSPPPATCRAQPTLPPSAVAAMRADYAQRELLARVLVGRAPLSALDEAGERWRVELAAMLLEQGVPPDRVDRELVAFLRRSARSIRRLVGDAPPGPPPPAIVLRVVRSYSRAPGRARRRRLGGRPSRFGSSSGGGDDGDEPDDAPDDARNRAPHDDGGTR